jgi:small-conductance mechanosensitive channel
MAFGADALEIELRIWIDDPQAGVANVRSEVLLNVWQIYRENGIDFPFSQRDLHIRSSVDLPVRLQRDTPEDLP